MNQGMRTSPSLSEELPRGMSDEEELRRYVAQQVSNSAGLGEPLDDDYRADALELGLVSE
jgi:hypothetical protein